MYNHTGSSRTGMVVYIHTDAVKCLQAMGHPLSSAIGCTMIQNNEVMSLCKAVQW